MSTPTVPESHLDLATTQTAALSTIGSSGRPQTTAVWFLLEDGVVRTSLAKSRQKYANLMANPKATVFVIDTANPFRTLEIRGDVTMEDDPDLAFFATIIRAYGQDPETFPAPREDRVVVTLQPRRVVVNG